MLPLLLLLVVAAAAPGSGVPSLAPAGAQAAGGSGLVGEALAHIEQFYWRPEEVDRAELLVAGLQRLEALGDDVLVTGPDLDGTVTVAVAGHQRGFSTRGLDSMAALGGRFQEAVAFVRAWHAQDPFDRTPRDAEVELLRGLLRPLDRHCKVIDAQRITDFNARYRGTLSGIGARIGKDTRGRLIIKEAYPATPSEQAGLRSGDAITHVDGVSTATLSTDEAVNLIRGPEATVVVLTIRRPGEAGPRDVPVTRRQVRVPSVTSARLPDGVGHVTIDHFSKQTSKEFGEHWERLNRDATGASAPLTGLIVDLRQNQGGSLVHAAGVAQRLIGSGTLVATEGRDGKGVEGLVQSIVARPDDDLPPIPVVVLVDHKTASGAEIVAGALKFLGRALVVGEETFGKGTVQKVYDLRDDVQLKLTVARYLVGGRWIDQVGVVPDVAVGEVWADPASPWFPDRLPDARTTEPGRPGAPGGGWHPSTTPPNDAPALRVLTTRPRGATEGAPFDPELDLAREVLAAAPGAPHRDALLAAARPVVERAAGRGAEAVAAAFLDLGIPWDASSTGWADRSPATSAREQAAVSRALPAGLAARLEVEGGRLTAGRSARIRLVVDNGGSTPLPAVRARLRSDLGALDGLGFALGDLPPGRSTERTAEVQIPARIPAQIDATRMYLVADGRLLGAPIETRIPVEGAPQPRFALRWRTQRSEEGGLGVVEVPVEVRNDGEGASGEVVVRMDGLAVAGFDPVAGRAELPSLAPGQAAEARLRLEIAPSAAPGPIRFSVVVEDPAFGVSTRAGVSLDPTRSEPLTGWRSPPRIVLRSGEATGPDGRWRLAGEATDDAGVVRVLASIDGDRVYAEAPARPSLRTPFTADLPLAPGPNTVRVEAVDAEGMRSFVRVRVLGAGPRGDGGEASADPADGE